MNIVIINQWYPPESGHGGIAKYNYYMANAYNKLGHQVFIISSGTEKGSTFEDRGGIYIYRIRQVIFPYFFSRVFFMGGVLRFLRDLIYSFSVRKILIKINREFKIDIVEYAEINTEGLSHGLFGPKNIPFIVRCHTPYSLLKNYYTKKEMFFYSPLFYWSEKLFISKAAHITTPTNDLRENISKIFKVNKEGISVVPNSIACDKAVKEDSNFKNQDKVTLLYVGRIERGKGIYTLAEAFLEVTKICKDKVKCVFIGDICPQYGGPSPQKTLIQFFTENNILQYVEFKGEVSEEELFAAYNMCDIFINPSLIYESFSYTCLEAMLCAKPVVASKIGGIPEVVSEGETGFLFEPGRKEELAEKLKLLIDDSQKRKSMGQAGRERVKNKFSSEEVAKQNIELYQKICKI